MPTITDAEEDPSGKNERTGCSDIVVLTGRGCSCGNRVVDRGLGYEPAKAIDYQHNLTNIFVQSIFRLIKTRGAFIVYHGHLE